MGGQGNKKQTSSTSKVHHDMQIQKRDCAAYCTNKSTNNYEFFYSQINQDACKKNAHLYTQKRTSTCMSFPPVSASNTKRSTCTHAQCYPFSVEFRVQTKDQSYKTTLLHKKSHFRRYKYKKRFPLLWRTKDLLPKIELQSPAKK